MKKRGVRDTDRGWRRIMQQAELFGRHVVTVGVQGAVAEQDHPGSDITNARLAGVHEFGAVIKTATATITIPERSFLRSTFDDNHARYTRAISRLGHAILAGSTTIDQALRLLGEKAASDVKRTIEKGIDPPNAESTVLRKGSSKPLVDTGVLRNSISYAIRPRGLGGET